MRYLWFFFISLIVLTLYSVSSSQHIDLVAQIKSNFDRGQSYFQEKNWQSALVAFDSAFSCTDSAPPSEYLNSLRSAIMINQGLCHRNLSHYNAAKLKFIAAKSFLSEHDTLQLIQLLINLADISNQTADYQFALLNMLEAQRLARQSVDLVTPDIRCAILENLSSILNNVGKKNEAEQYLKQTADCIKQPEATDYLNGAEIKLNDGNLLGAFHDVKQAVSLAEKENNPLLSGLAYLIEGRVLMRMERFPEARASLEQAKEIARQKRNYVQLVEILCQIGFLEFQLHKYDKSREMFKHALEIGESLGLDDLNWYASYGMASVFRAMKKNNDAELYYRSSIRTIDTLQTFSISAESEISSFKKYLFVYNDFVRFLIDRSDFENALLFFEKSKYKRFSELFVNKKMNQLPPFRDKQIAYQYTLTELEKKYCLLYELNDSVSLNGKRQIRHRIDSIKNELSVIYTEQQLNTLKCKSTIKNIDFKKLQQRINLNTRILEYCVFQDCIGCWNITRDTIIFKKLAIESQHVLNQVGQYLT